MAFLPGGSMLVTDKSGKFIKLIRRKNAGSKWGSTGFV
jgi:hypothetical protein